MPNIVRMREGNIDAVSDEDALWMICIADPVSPAIISHSQRNSKSFNYLKAGLTTTLTLFTVFRANHGIVGCIGI